jgi:hypothetical protein
MSLFAGGAQLSGPSPFKVAMTTLFWVGEPSTEENDFICRRTMAASMIRERINKPWPGGFAPEQNAFYVALPYGEFTYDDTLKTGAHRVPLYRSGLGPLLKNRWVKIKRDGSCFALW